MSESAWGTPATTVQKATPWPVGKYRLTQAAEMPIQPGAMRLFQPAETEVFYDGRPAPHMEPLDAQAHANVRHVIEHYGVPNLDPTNALSLVLGEVDNADSEIAQLQAKIVALQADKRSSTAAGRPGTPEPPPAIAGAGTTPPPLAPHMAAEGVEGQGGVRPPELPAYMVPKAPPLASIRG